LLLLYDRWIRPEDVSGCTGSRQNPYRVNRLINQAIRDEVSTAARAVFLPSRLYGGTSW
jgi:hypothetical protein